jgi:mRNA interferase RelE/StbE
MRYTLIYKRSAAEELLKLPSSAAQKVKSAIDQLVDNPRPVGCKKLTGTDDSYRIRIGNYRVIYTVFDSLLIVTIIKVAHRKDAYR